MQVQRIHIGGWFQRTTLHLSEIYDFLISGSSSLNLDADKLTELKKKLHIVSAELQVDGFEYIKITTKDDLTIKVFEDGLIVLQNDFKDGDEISKDIKILTDYYEQRLSPAFSYIFSLGAPIPKELANIKTVYPYFVVLNDATRTEIEGLLEKFKQKKYFEVTADQFELFRGDKFYIINSKGATLDMITRFIEEQIFLREFKGQLHRYLNLHRIIWERIADVKERGQIKGGDVGAFKDKVEGYAKTINLIETRINQMGTYLHTRESIAKKDVSLSSFNTVLEYRYEALGNTLSYLKEIWVMTKNYVDSATKLFSDLQAQATQDSVENLTIVTSMGVGATIIGLFTTDSVPEFTVFGFGYFIVLALIGYGSRKATQWFYTRKTYSFSDVDYDKSIE